MNVNRLYFAQIYITYEETSGSFRGTLREFEVKGKFLKNTIVYHDDSGRYIDLVSGEKYKLGIDNTYLGDMYIYLKNGLIPINNVLDVSFKKHDMPKKKILKLLNEEAKKREGEVEKNEKSI